MKKLTVKQAMVLEAIEYLIKENGYPPSLEEIGKLVKKTKSTVYKHIISLEKRGYVKTQPCKQRTIKVLKGIEND